MQQTKRRFGKLSQLFFFSFLISILLVSFCWHHSSVLDNTTATPAISTAILLTIKQLIMDEMVDNDVLSLTKRNMQDYGQSHDVQYVAEDGVFKNMATGDIYKGRKEVGAMLDYMYHTAFEATAETTNEIITEDRAVLEGYFKGKHIGEFAGMPATHKEVKVPLCVIYDLEGGFINEARIYMPVNLLMQQLTT